jgi:sugar phosphate isomerase/epimerase
MSAIAINSLCELGHWLPETLARIGREKGWSILYIEVAGEDVEMVDLDTVEPGLREQIRDAAEDYGLPIYAEIPEQDIEKVRRQVRENKVVSIQQARIAGKSKVQGPRSKVNT